MNNIEKNSKNGNTFIHDSNARSDHKILKIRRKFGMAGYGMYWSVLEILRASKDYKLEISADVFDDLAYDLRVEPELITEFCLEAIRLELFVVEKSSKILAKDQINQILTSKSLANPSNCLAMLESCYFLSKRMTTMSAEYDQKGAELRAKRQLAGRKGGLAKAENNKGNQKVASKPLANAKQMPSKILASNSNSNSNSNPNSNINKLIKEWSPPAQQAFKDWVEYRKQAKKKLTDLSIKRLVKKWESSQTDFIKSVGQSIENGWQGLFPVKDDQPVGQGQNFATRGNVGASRGTPMQINDEDFNTF